MFVGRKRELEKLNWLYEKDGFQMIVVYGRRRVGKTTLLKRFSEGKNCIFFVCDEVNEKVMLDNFSKTVLEHFEMNDFWDRLHYLATSYPAVYGYLGLFRIK